MKKSKEISSRFVKVRCNKCKNEQIIFGKIANVVKCVVCDSIEITIVHMNAFVLIILECIIIQIIINNQVENNSIEVVVTCIVSYRIVM